MTLVLAINGVESVWMMADRRLSGQGVRPRDDAVKVFLLGTRDCEAIIGYSGLGATSLGTQPSDWMSTVLRGRSLTLEQSLQVLANAIQREIPRHVVGLSRSTEFCHLVLVTALYKYIEVRCYAITLTRTHPKAPWQVRYGPIRTRRPGERPPRFAITGSGAACLSKSNEWQRPLLRLVNAHDHRKLSAARVADELARFNQEVRDTTPDGTVGPHCIVV